MTKQEFADQYKHPKWQKRRLEILERDGYKCQKCGDEETMLHVHHLKYLKNKPPWESPRGDLVTLCRDCHKLITWRKPSLNEFSKIQVIKVRSGDDVIYFASICGELHISQGFYTDDPKHIEDISKIINHVIKQRKNG